MARDGKGEAAVLHLPKTLDYPLVAIGDLHGQLDDLERLIGRLEVLSEWPDTALDFLGDFVDRNPGVKATIDLVIELLRRPAGGAAVKGNHDLALIRAARLDGGSPSPFWVQHYRGRYGHQETFESYLGRTAMAWGDAWEKDLDALRDAIPDAHKDFLTSLPWLVEAPGHLFLHNGLSNELSALPEEQVQAMRAKLWDRKILKPLAGTHTDRLWEDDYPVWLGADRRLSESPLPHPVKVQVTGHDRVRRPHANDVRIRLDTSGGRGALTACLLRSATDEPVFLQSR